MNQAQNGLLAAFVAAGVEFVIVGGVAVIAHGYVRTTKDLDIFFRPTEENAKLAFAVLQAQGAPVEGLAWDDLLIDYENLRFGPRGAQVDMLSSIGEISFDRVWRNRVELVVEGQSLPVISRADLIANKKEVGRSQDVADVEVLERLPRPD